MKKKVILLLLACCMAVPAAACAEGSDELVDGKFAEISVKS